MGEYVQKLNTTVCNKFRATILKGRRCYTVDVNEFKNQVDNDKLMSHGLIFMMDYNEDRLGLNTRTAIKTSADMDYVDMQKKEDIRQEAMIHIETLGMLNYKYNGHFYNITILSQNIFMK